MIERTLRKFYNNILSPRAYSVLGLNQYTQMLGTLATKVPAILRSRDLRPLDRAMAGKIDLLNYRGHKFKLDLKYCDTHVRDGSFAFGGVREIYIRDCYLRFHHPSIYQSARTVVDIGANRGIFSTLMATVADFVLCVEAQPHFIAVIERNMAINRFTNYAIECALIGSGGAIGGKGGELLTMDQLLQRHGLDHVDLVKMDIEGSEFSLFEAEDWLDQVGAISMEVHRDYGDPAAIAEKLEAHGFKVVAAEENLELVTDRGAVDFIFASRRRTS